MESGEGAIALETGAEIAAEMIRVRLTMDQFELYFSRLSARFAKTEEYDEQGFDSPIAWIKANCHMSGGAAADRVCAGELARSQRCAGGGDVIDVGRARRVVSGPQGKALRVRDKGCVWPGCDRPASWTSAHHIAHWIHGGPTDLHNLVLLCYRHHWMVHEGGWQIVRSDDGRMLTIPPVTEYQRLARGPD